MKNLLLISAILISSGAVAQKKKSVKYARVPPPTIEKVKYSEPPPPPENEYEEKCFAFRMEEQKNGKTYVTNELLEFGRGYESARMVITESSFDPIDKKKAEANGYELVTPRTMQFINGKYLVSKENLKFTPENTDKFQQRNFKIIYKSKSKNISYLLDEKGNKFNRDKCSEPVISL